MVELKSIIRELKQQRAHIDAALKALTSLSSTATARHVRKGRRSLSPAARRRIAAAQRARWALWRKGKKK